MLTGTQKKTVQQWEPTLKGGRGPQRDMAGIVGLLQLKTTLSSGSLRQQLLGVEEVAWRSKTLYWLGTHKSKFTWGLTSGRVVIVDRRCKQGVLEANMTRITHVRLRHTTSLTAVVPLLAIRTVINVRLMTDARVGTRRAKFKCESAFSTVLTWEVGGRGFQKG